MYVVEMPSTPDPLAAAVLRVRYPDGTAVGVGFLVTGELAVTCAHVVASALGLDDDERPAAGATVEVDLPLGPVDGTAAGPVDGTAAGPVVVPAEVEYWPEDGPSGARDIAVLRLRSTVPGSVPLRMAEADDVWGHPVRTFGFPARHDDGVWHAGVLRARQGTGWLQVEWAASSNHAISRGFSGAPVWDERLGAVVGMVVAADPQQPSAFLIPTGELLLAVPSLREAVLPPSPFRGLSAFQESDSAVFHGRDEESDEVAALVTEHPVVTVFGPSGCGKSSLVRAGVVPRLRKAGHAVVVIRPGGPSGLLGGLAMELTRLTRPELSGSARREESRVVEAELSVHGWGEILAQLMGAGGATSPGAGGGASARAGGGTRARTGTRRARGVRGLVVVVDQLEEILDHGPAARSAAEAVAALFPEHPPPGLRVLSTLRADFLEAVSARPGLERVLRGKSLLLPAMSAEQVRQAVVLPVEAIASVAYADGLEQRILADCGDAHGVLPLLEFTLDQLWERRRGGLLTHRAYEELGGVSGALAERAETVWRRAVREADGPDQAEGADEATARRLFTRLVRLPLGGPAATRRVVPRAELGEPEWTLAQALARERLVVIGLDDEKRETVELAHEALIRAWDRLGAWVERDRDFLAWREGIRHDRERWEAAGRAPDLLPAASALDTARRWERERGEDLSEADADFLRRGRDRERTRTLRRRGLFTGIGTVLALAAVLGSLFVFQTGVTEERAAAADSRSMAATSTDLRATDPALSALLAISAYRRSPTESARDALLQSYLTYGRARWLMSGTLGKVERVAASGDGRVVLTTTVLGRATLFVRGDDGEIRSAHLPAEAEARYPVVASDGSGMGYVGRDGALVWHEVRPETARLMGPARTMAVETTDPSGFVSPRGAAISSDGSRVAAVVGGHLAVWDLDKGTVVRTISPPAGQDSFVKVWFGPGRDTLLASAVRDADALADNAYTVLAYQESRAPRTVATGVHGAEVSGDGTALACCRVSDGADRGLYRVVRIADGEERGRFTDTKQCGTKIVVDRTGLRVGVGDIVRTLMRLFDTEQRKLVAVTGTQTEPQAGGGFGNREAFPRLLEDGGRTYLLSYDSAGAAMTALSADAEEFLPRDDRSFEALTPDGSTVVGKTPDGAELRTYAVGQGFKEVASVKRPDPVMGGEPGIRISGDGSLVADPAVNGEIHIREVPSLRRIATVPTGVFTRTVFRFADERYLLVATRDVIERWDARTGRPAGRIDLSTTDLADTVTDDPFLGPYPREGHVAVLGDRYIHVVDLGEGREVTELRIDVGNDATGVRFDAEGNYLAVLRRGGVWELWRLDPLRRELGPMPGVGEGGDFVFEFMDAEGRLLVADAGRVRVYRAGSRTYEAAFNFGTQSDSVLGTFPAAAQGPTVLYTNDAQTTAVRLDPEEWAGRLCAVIGQRTLTRAERDAVPAEVPPGAVCGD
ncbi:trypsin-like peptidase domain-containing protein [Streptomyces sp. NPDC102274]|uniref:nSTAND1 domain-containing NTPase n=1 Tax=Streptomyces sp. NPDC102274 TaxID=3366151 RepID=UPI003822DBF3